MGREFTDITVLEFIYSNQPVDRRTMIKSLSYSYGGICDSLNRLLDEKKILQTERDNKKVYCVTKDCAEEIKTNKLCLTNKQILEAIKRPEVQKKVYDILSNPTTLELVLKAFENFPQILDDEEYKKQIIKEKRRKSGK